MPRTVPFLIALLIGLALLVLGGYVVLTRTTRSWFESDLALRSGLAVASAKQGLIQSWSASPSRLRAILSDIARDERVMGTGAHSPTGELLASSRQFPEGTRLDEGVTTLGLVVLAHDLSYTEQRERAECLVILSNREPYIHERTPEEIRLVAKEFVAARDDEQGVLILSQFTGAARELTEALIVNPYDLDEAGNALAAASRMSQAEQRVRMRSMRRPVSEFNVFETLPWSQRE